MKIEYSPSMSEITHLSKLVEIALANYNLETQLDSKELPLDDEITLDTCDDEDNLVVYAISDSYVVTTKGDKVDFNLLDGDDIYTLQDIIHDTYDIDYLNA